MTAPDKIKAEIENLATQLRADSGPQALLAIVFLVDRITEGDDVESTALLQNAIEHIGDRHE